MTNINTNLSNTNKVYITKIKADIHINIIFIFMNIVFTLSMFNLIIYLYRTYVILLIRKNTTFNQIFFIICAGPYYR